MSRLFQTEYGVVSSQLDRELLSDLCVEKIGIQTGPFGSQLHKEDYVDFGTPIITVEHLGDNRILHENTPYVSDDDKERLSKYSIITGDIVFSRVGSVDRRALVRIEEHGWLFSGRCLRVRADLEKIDPVFLSYFFGMEGFKSYIRSIAVGATMPSINTKILSDIPVYFPSMEKQREIGRALLDLDEQIELNRQTNQTLEQVAQAIFKSWFVDFEPVKAKQHIRALGGNDERTERAAQAVIAGAVNLDTITTAADLSALDRRLIQVFGEKLAHQTDAQREQLATTAGHFPDRLVESELGLIPEGWVPTTLSKIIKLIGGGTPKKSESRYWNGAIPWFSVKDAPDDGQVFVLDTDLKITDAGLSESSTRLLDEGTTIISARGTVGRLALVGVPMAMNQSCYGVTGADGIPPIFNYFNLRRAVDVLKQNTHGAVFDTITRATFETVDQIIPQKEVIRCFEATVESLMFQVKSNGLQSHNLAQLRDVLLPKLISGESTCTEAISTKETVS